MQSSHNGQVTLNFGVYSWRKTLVRGKVKTGHFVEFECLAWKYAGDDRVRDGWSSIGTILGNCYYSLERGF